MTPSSKLLLDKLTVLRLVKNLWTPDCPFSCSQEPITCSYPQPDKSIPRRLKTRFNIVLASRPMSLECFFFRVYSPKHCTHSLLFLTCNMTSPSYPLSCYIHEIEIRMKVVIHFVKHFVFSLRKARINYFIYGKMAPQLTTIEYNKKSIGGKRER